MLAKFLIQTFILLQFYLDIQADAGICSKCIHFLNKPQCTTSNCEWQNRTCQDKPKEIKPLSTSSGLSNSASLSNSVGSKNINLLPTCASQSQGCYGNDGTNIHMQCSYNYDNNCVPVDITKVCNVKKTQYECQVYNICDWNITSKICKIRLCSGIQYKSECQYVLNSIFQAKACQWIPYQNATKLSAQTAGYCEDGVAADIPKDLCELPRGSISGNYEYGYIYYTFDNSTQTCTECTEIVVNSAASSYLYSCMFILLLILFIQ